MKDAFFPVRVCGKSCWPFGAASILTHRGQDTRNSGMRILRKALRQALQEHPHVESLAKPPQNEGGGGGATVVELRI